MITEPEAHNVSVGAMDARKPGSRWRQATLCCCVLVTVLNVTGVWFFRFLPLYDYPIWLYVVKIVRGISGGVPLYSDAFEFVKAPIPNMASVGLVWMLGCVTTVEIAGKILLTVCVSAFPWVWWWSSRRISGEESPWAFLGFPFALNLFFWGRLGYLSSLILLILVLGVFLPKSGRLAGRDLVLLSAVSVLFFLLHAVVCAIWSVVLVMMLWQRHATLAQKLRVVFSVLAPALMCALWFAATMPGPTWSVTSLWSPEAIVRSVLKPLMIFIKSYGIASPGPVSLYNILWLMTLAVCAILYIAGHGSRCRQGRSWLVAGAVVLACGVLLPLNTLGVFQPGTYFVFPALFLLSVSARSVRHAGAVSAAMLLFALAVSIYSLVLVSRVDSQMQEFYNDLNATVDVARPHTVILLDWPAETGLADRVSASVNPLFGVPFYALLERDGLSWIFETSVVRLKPAFSWLRSPIAGATRLDYQHSVEGNLEWCLRFPQIIVLGANESSAAIVKMMEQSGYRTLRKGSAWTILARNG